MELKTVADKLIIVPIKEELKTASGIILSQSDVEKVPSGEVIQIGPDVKYINIGDTVYYPNYNINSIKIEGNDYMILQEKDIKAFISKKSKKKYE